MVLSDWGLKGLWFVGVEEEVKKLCIFMNGRMIYDKEGNIFLSLYSGCKDEYINFIFCLGLNMLLLDVIDKMLNVIIYFNLGCEDVNLENVLVSFKNYKIGKIESF